MGPFVDLTAADGFTFPAYVAEPTGKPKGAIVVVQEIFGVNQVMRDITDGTSNTVFLSEIIGQEGNGDCRGAWGRVGCNTFSPHTRNPNDAFIVTPNRWINGQKEIYDCPPYCGLETSNQQDACYDCSGSGTGGVGARSFHPGGVNVGLGDGSTRFVAETIDGILWRNVTTIQAGDSNAGFAN